LLLLTGTQPDEIVVIERTPARNAVRYGVDGFIAVTNDYRVLESAEADGESVLRATSCGRFERVEQLVCGLGARSLEECIDHLSDPGVKMGITVQQMAFNARAGEFLVRAS
jgi:hypothetical protein